MQWKCVQATSNKHACRTQIVTPWEVQADGAVDYNKLVNEFGSQLLGSEHLERMRKLGMPIHHFLRRYGGG